jgi:hypothetical protein
MNPLDGDCAELDISKLREGLRQDFPSDLSPGTHVAMLARMGRNLLMFIHIEGCLKKTLPYAHPDASTKGSEALATYQHKIRNKPLGYVMKATAQSLTSDDMDEIRKSFKVVVDQRNALVHHFLDQPGIAITEEGARNAIRWLDDQEAGCRPMLEYAQAMLLAVSYGMERAAADRGEERLIPSWHLD